MSQSFSLKTLGGKYLRIKKLAVKGSRPRLQLFVLDAQGDESQAQDDVDARVHKHEGTNAFKLSFQKDQMLYYLKVNGKELELENSEGPQTDATHYCFKILDLGLGEHYGLCTLASPVMYVCTEKTKLALSDNSASSLPVTLAERQI